MSDLISRQAAIELVKDVCDAIMSGCKRHYDSEVGDEVYDDTLEVDAILKCNKGIRNALRHMPSAKPEEIALRALHESCTDCPLYDKDRHRCPRFNKVIPETLREVISAQPERKKGKWIQTDELWTDMYTAEEQNIYECACCGEEVIGKPDWRFCPNCGCQMQKGDSNDKL